MKKKLIIILSIFAALIVLLFIVTNIFSFNYKIVCEREETGLKQVYNYEFNLIGAVKKFKYETHVLFENNENAKLYYEDSINSNVIDEERFKLKNNTVIIDNTYPEQKLASHIFNIKKVYSKLDYSCKVVKK